MNTEREARIVTARLAKAQKLADVLLSHGAVGSDVPRLPPASRRTVETLAGTREGSDETWGLVADIVATRRAIGDCLAARIDEVTSDPFGVGGFA